MTDRDPSISAIFQPDPAGPVRALLVAGSCGNVGFGKLGQFARVLARHGVPVIALDLSPDVLQVRERLAKEFSARLGADEIAGILAAIHPIQGTLADLPEGLPLGFVFEAIPEKLSIKHPFYAAVRARDPEAFIFSATSGLTTHKLFDGLPGSERCGVLHPFFPHLTNKLWELPEHGAVTGKAEGKLVKAFLARAGMNLISVRDVPSFAADRLFCGMMLEAVRIHASTGLSPAQIDDACKQLLGTQPFFVHNLIRGANRIGKFGGPAIHAVPVLPADVLVFGEALVDMFPDKPGLPLEEVEQFVRHLGGAPCNLAVNLCRQGVRAALYTMVGTDAFGRFVKRQLADEGVAVVTLVSDVPARGRAHFVGIDNVADTRAWKESPYQFGHAYLFPLAPRTWRVSVQADL